MIDVFWHDDALLHDTGSGVFEHAPSSLMAEPAGIVRPWSKIRSDVPSIRPGRPADTGWRCIGFHSGRVSMSAASIALPRSSAVQGETSGSTTIAVNQQLSSESSDAPTIRTPGW